MKCSVMDARASSGVRRPDESRDLWSKQKRSSDDDKATQQEKRGGGDNEWHCALHQHVMDSQWNWPSMPSSIQSTSH
jgi:hypothetical protein